MKTLFLLVLLGAVGWFFFFSNPQFRADMLEKFGNKNDIQVTQWMDDARSQAPIHKLYHRQSF